MNSHCCSIVRSKSIQVLMNQSTYAYTSGMNDTDDRRDWGQLVWYLGLEFAIHTWFQRVEEMRRTDVAAACLLFANLLRLKKVELNGCQLPWWHLICIGFLFPDGNWRWPVNRSIKKRFRLVVSVSVWNICHLYLNKSLVMETRISSYEEQLYPPPPPAPPI